MSKSAVRYGKRTAARIRAIRRRAAEWKRRARRALTLALVTAGIAAAPSLAEAQTGQVGMAPTGGIVNRAVAGLQDFNQNGPGWLYYGINAADRGLGYNGSYMTLGGFVPYAEDDLGGFWAADLRSHLSEYGGFFSNVGAVRKQFIGGTLFGVGVYWDYDADANQYPVMGIPGTDIFGQFGHVYNQVGVSLEWLTDYGNLRSNGYIPVGTTGYIAGAPGSPFFQNFLMCENGLDAALTGADLEIGAYVPALADWAGMISVGGYALGNPDYNYAVGSQAGQEIIPWFGGVYTRLDMTFIENWDFSLQANNDSYFDWTGFARLTYRMGGSRRRNVPDQVEQPMMRNEHIVRAHQTPVVALNPNNGGQPWRVIHVNNAAQPVGNGTAEAPFTTITNANAAATNPWDIVLVARGNSRVNLNPASPAYGDVTNAYAGTFSPLAANQYFIGSGSPFFVPTTNCDPINVGGLGGTRPVLSNPTGPSINLSAGLVTQNFDIVNSAVGISGSGNLSAPGAAGRPSFARNIDIYRTDPNATGRGIEITGATGSAMFRRVNIGKVVTIPGGTENWTMTDGSVVVDGGSPTVDFANGTIVNTQDHILQVSGTLGGEVVLTANPGQPFSETGDGILVDNAAGNVTVKNATPGMTSVAIASNKDGIKVVNSAGIQTFDDVQITQAGGAGGAGFAGVNLQNNAGTSNFNNLTVTLPDPNVSPGFLAINDNVINVTGNSSVTVDNAVAVSMTKVVDVAATFNTITSVNSPTNGLLLDNVAGIFSVTSGLTVTNATQDGVVIRNSPTLVFNSPTTTVSSAAGDGVVLQNNSLTAADTNLGQLNVTTTAGSGLVVTSAGATTLGGTINATGGASIAANVADLDVTLASASSANSTGPGLDLTSSSGIVSIAQTNVVTPAGNGINAVDNVPSFKADFGATKVSGITNGAIGVNIDKAIEPLPATAYSFDSLDITTTNGTGLRTRNGGTVNFNSPATIRAFGGEAIDLENTVGTTGGVIGSGFTFLDLTSFGSVSNGVRLNNLNSDLTVTGTTAIDSAAGVSLSITDTIAPPQTDSISFNQVLITSRNNVGMVVDGIYGQVQIANLTIDNANNVAGNAVLIRDTTNPLDPIGTGSGRVYINGGTISDSAGNGIEVRNALAAITGVTVAGAQAQSIIATAASGEQTTVEVSNSTLTGAVGIDGLRLEATGGGIVNGTIVSSLVNVPGAAVNAIVFDPASFISLNASGNFGGGGLPPQTSIILDNQGGVLQIEQPNATALSTANNGATVVILLGPITQGTTAPVPPPTP